MIKIIYGPKGTGKTTKIIEEANATAQAAKGLSVFITDNSRCRLSVNHAIRFIDVRDWTVAGEDALCGFIKGVAACNGDHEYIYIDGLARIAGKSLNDLAGIFYMLDKISNENNITITITCSGEKAELPDFVKKYL
ncbi:MAG: hypothetical protein K2I20_06730 [Clostridia bacterium]|nr:hypothetical protein [Clostridia bacterium]MDE7214793.1 hypothetical protein [Clostridia bacterium]